MDIISVLTVLISYKCNVILLNMVNKHNVNKNIYLTLKSNTHNETDSMLNPFVATLLNKHGTTYQCI